MVSEQFLFILQAALFATIWLIYLRKLDIFHPEKWVNMVIVFLIGLGTPLLVMYAPHVLKDFYMTQSHWDNFQGFFLHVGLVEEAAKILPLILIALFTKWIDEPIDYVIYASLLALGFSATENVVYMNRTSPEILAVRGLVSSFGHICFTSIAVYGWVEGRYRFKKLPVLFAAWSFILAGAAHAMFDFLLTVHGGWNIVVFIVFFIFLLEVWALIINNSLNNSEHYHKKTVVDDDALQYYLRAGFIINAAAQCVITYMLLGDFEKGVLVYAACIFSAAFFFLVVSTRLTHFTLVPGKWYTLFPQVPMKAQTLRVKPPGDYKRSWLFDIKGNDPNETVISAFLEHEIELVPLSGQNLPIAAVIKGTLQDKLFLKKDEVFYLFRSSVDLPNSKYDQRLLVLKAFDGMPNLINDIYPVVAILAVPPQINWNEPQRYHRKDFPFIQWMAIKPAGGQKITGHRVTDLSNETSSIFE